MFIRVRIKIELVYSWNHMFYWSCTHQDRF